MTTKASKKLTLKDRLSRLTFTQACKLLGEDGKQLIQRGGAQYDEIDLDDHVYCRGDLFRLTLPSAGSNGANAIVTLTTMAEKRDRLLCNCDSCETACEHVGAAFALILEDKSALGLAAPPPQRKPVESLGEEELVEQALAQRAEKAAKEKFRLNSGNPKRPWTDYTITSAASGKTYRVALRGDERGISFCSCPDYRTNSLGTCKHVIYALDRVRSKFTAAQRRQRSKRKSIAIHLHYVGGVTLQMALPDDLDEEVAKIVKPLRDKPIDDVHKLLKRVRRIEGLGHNVTIYPDAEEYIQQRLFQDHIADVVAEIRRDPENHPLRNELLKTQLLPYQMDGIAFAVGAGRAVLADDMGLGKTIQGVGVAELLAREAGIKRVLVICPASLKSQWRNEVQRFSDRDCQLITGSAHERAEQYDNDCFFTVCNLRTSVTRHHAHRASQVGSDHSGRRPADQELGSKDQQCRQGTEIAVRIGTLRHAVGKSTRRFVFRRAVHRRSEARSGVSFLQPPSSDRRKRQSAGIQEP